MKKFRRQLLRLFLKFRLRQHLKINSILTNKKKKQMKIGGSVFSFFYYPIFVDIKNGIFRHYYTYKIRRVFTELLRKLFTLLK